MAIKRAAGAIAIDGDLSDAGWNRLAPAARQLFMKVSDAFQR